MKGIDIMKQYTAPEMDLLLISVDDVITPSPGNDDHIYGGELD